MSPQVPVNFVTPSIVYFVPKASQLSSTSQRLCLSQNALTFFKSNGLPNVWAIITAFVLFLIVKLVNKIKEELKQDIDIVRKQKANSLLSNEKCEEIFTHDVTENIKFVGFIDKLMYKQTDDEILASVVDYKTSKSIEIDKDIMKFGLSLQLPSYLYLIKHSSTFDKNVRIVGLYIQHIINYDNKYRDINTQLTQNKEESMKLDGISSIDPDRLSMLDISLNSSSKSETIKGISINKDGSLKKSAKLYSDDQFDDLSNLVEENIKIAGNTIISGDFSINPKQIDKVNKSCEYCKYAAICYRRNDDIKHYSTKEEQ